MTPQIKDAIAKVEIASADYGARKGSLADVFAASEHLSELISAAVRDAYRRGQVDARCSCEGGNNR